MKPSLPFVFLLITQLPGYLNAQADFGGYFEAEMDQMRSRGTDYVFGYNKVRLELEVSPVEGAVFRANMNTQLYYGRDRWNLFDFLPLRITDPLAGAGMTEFPFSLRDTLYLDNAFLKMTFPAVDLTLGKQQLSLGTGYAWNPLDIFNRKRLLDPTYEQTGVESVRIEAPLAERFMLDVIVSPGDDWDSSARLLRAKAGLGRFDITATTGTFLWKRTGFDWTTYEEKVMGKKRNMTGWAAVGEVFQWGIWTEGSWNTVEGEEDFLEFLVGADHTFDFSTYLLAELYHNGAGTTERDSLQLPDYTSYFLGETHSLMQDYLFVFVTHPVTDLLTVGILGIANVNDGSMILNPDVEYSLLENVHVSLLLSGSRGDENSEFGLQDWGARLRLRAYF